MPTFVTEGLIFGKPSIVSEHTGTAGLISEGRNGFVYHDDDPQQLAVLLEHAIEHPEELASMRTECRKMYEQYYSKEAFVADAPGRCGRSDSEKVTQNLSVIVFAMPPLPYRGSWRTK